MNKNDCEVILETVINVLKEQAETYAGTIECQCPWQVLSNIRSIANVLGVDLAELGLDGYNIDNIIEGLHPVTGEKVNANEQY